MSIETTEIGQTTIQMAGPSLKTQVIGPLGAYIWPARLCRGYNQLVGVIQNTGLGLVDFNVYFSPDPAVAGWTLEDTYPVAAGAHVPFATDVFDESIRIEAVEAGGLGATVTVNANLVPISGVPSGNVIAHVLSQLRTLTTTHHTAAIVAAVGANATIAEYSNGIVQITSGPITSGTVVFQVSTDGVNWVPTLARNLATGVLATGSTLADATNEIWLIDVSGGSLFRANLTAIVPAASSVTITSKVTSGSAANILATAVGAGNVDDSVQRTILATDTLVEECDAIGTWVASLGGGGLVTDLNHILGSNSLEFDKVAGNILALLGNVGISVDASGYNPTDVISLSFQIPDLTDVINVIVRLGTDATNYNEWTLPVARMQAAIWQTWSPSIGSQNGFLGNGMDMSAITYVAFGVTFNLAADLLPDMFLDHIILRKVAFTGAQINSEIITKIDSADINLHEVRGTATAVDSGAPNAGTQRTASVTLDGVGDPAVDADPLPVEVGDGTNQLIVAVRALASVGNGLLKLIEYNAVPAAVADGQLVPAQSGAFGHEESAAYNRPLGSNQVVEQSPPEYDILANVAKVLVALPAAGAYDVPIEISTGGRTNVKFWFIYTRGGAAGSFRVYPEAAVIESGADHWGGMKGIVNTGAFAAGANVDSQFQEETFSSQPSGVAAETPTLEFDALRSNKIRISARELGNVGAPGQLEILYLLSN